MDDSSETNTVTSGASEHKMMKAMSRRARLARTAALGDDVRKAQQLLARLQQREAKCAFQDKLVIGNVAEAVGLTGIAFSDLQLRGALLSVVEASRDPNTLKAFEAAGKTWLASRRPARGLGDSRVFVTAATIGAELAAACTELRLRRHDMPKGYTGRLALAQALELGRVYNATVHVKHNGEELRLIDRGAVDATLLDMLSAKTGMDRTSAQDADGSVDNIVRDDADASVTASTTSGAPAMAASTTDGDSGLAEAVVAIPRRYHAPLRPLRRPDPR